MTHTVVVPGSFDPVTLGHLDVIARAAALFDEVVVAVGVNASKRRLFSAEERMDLLRRACADLPSVRVAGFEGLVTGFCAEIGAQAIVKGLRTAQDYEYELPMAHMNTRLTGVTTLFLPTSPEHAFVSSSLVKEVAAFGGDTSAFLPAFVHEALVARLAERSAGGGS
ncbi:pantetheine-phosphate adenylyltransferase [Nocardioides bruguierae]|uniref:Phosphopantetheine adenylyltransferase n=1 Tax=Nocardioides bruguierae TaxID=2945102 RepID=A0A9X2D610_9ACTN|nr:pantetheine-phosphate adenylyltransferase [Nocardioides bruguierae]MCL8026598.1 pantetheine-phosphate adenylyltransferase [Nocardioides bruguierae]MCM0619669.1 pantetheine-phosphate adenylyltransferase [Nocardioides bruguierae]